MNIQSIIEIQSFASAILKECGSILAEFQAEQKKSQEVTKKVAENMEKKEKPKDETKK